MVIEHSGVRDALDTIEDEYDVTVLSAREYGSRAWNLDSSLSDRDVAIVFKQPPADYIGLRTYQDTIGTRRFQNDDVEVMGWNLQNFMEKLYGSNPTAMEFLASDVRYIEDTFGDIEKYMMNNFLPISLLHHYRKMGKEQYNRYIADGKKPTVKKNLYVLRALLYMRYVEQHHEFPPIDFMKFLDTTDVAPRPVYQKTVELARLKKSGKNTEVGNPLKEFIEDNIERPDIEPTAHKPHRPEKDRLDELLHEQFGDDT